MNVEDVMTTHPVTVHVETTVKEALALLEAHRLTTLPVLDQHGRVCGVVSEADLIRDRLPEDQRHQIIQPQTSRPTPSSLVGDVYTPHAVTVGPHDDVTAAVELLTSSVIKSVPVVDRRGMIVGVLSRSDIVHVLTRADADIEGAVTEMLKAVGHPEWSAEAHDGVVAIEGPGSDRERSLARATALSVTGVVDVRIE
ncbi:HPP family protein [Nocardioides sp.]|uniref:CBS domain-containing protein n=1 Tax=Nocardioides sp. TaxID=35761 RepID=UPI003563D82C